MEGNGLRGGVFSNLSPGILGLEMPVQPQQQQTQPPQQQQNNPHHFHPQMVAFARPEPPLPTMKQQPRQLPTPLSDDEDAAMDDNPAADAQRKASSPWQRMKWTDTMVRLLIMAVYYIGDECGSDATTNNNCSDAARKKAGALMQKKGKWKSVSKAMMEKGFYVSPQQCEDKFNDLNKRYKRVNEILGKGSACRVVENQSLLEQMDHLNAKSKEEVRKLLNSKHLFFREMCAYHNSCGNGLHQSPSENHQQVIHTHHNSSHDTTADDNNNNPSEDDSEDEDHDESEQEDEESEQLQVRRSTKRHIEEEGEGNNNGTATSLEMALRGLEAEMAEVMEDGRRSGWEKKRWLTMRMVKVKEERVGKEKEGLEIEKERLKWMKYCGKKEREMERKKLKNERANLECDRMVLLLKRKEVEMMAILKNRAAVEPQPPSSVTGC